MYIFPKIYTNTTKEIMDRVTDRLLSKNHLNFLVTYKVK